MSLETVSIEHIPSSYTVHVALYRDVQNAAFLHKQLLERNVEFEYAFIDASTVLSRRQLLSAIFKAIVAAENGCLKTPNVHSETVLSLNISNNISDSYRRFGISPATKHLIAVKVTHLSGPAPGDLKEIVRSHLATNVEGTALNLTDANLQATADVAKIGKHYKLNGLKLLADTKKDDANRAEVETLILGSIALRGT